MYLHVVCRFMHVLGENNMSACPITIQIPTGDFTDIITAQRENKQKKHLNFFYFHIAAIKKLFIQLKPIM